MAEEAIKEEEEKVGLPSLDEMLKDDGFKKQFQSQLDSAVSKGVEAYKSGSFQIAVDKATEAKLEALKTKSPEQLQVEEVKNQMAALQKTIDDERNATTRAKNKNVALTGLTEKGLPAGLGDFITGDTEDETIKQLDNMTNVISEYVQGLKADGLKNNNIEVPHKETLSGAGLKIPKADASAAEWEQYYIAKRNK